MTAPLARAFLVALALLVALIGQTARAQEPAGLVVRTQGEVWAVGQHGRRNLQRRDAIRVGDRLFTGAGARLGLRMRDGAVLELGADTEFVIADYRFRRGGADNVGVLELSKGVFRAITGAIMREPEARFEVRTKAGTIGVRGTDFWGGFYFSSALDVVMLEGRGVYVENASGRVELSTPLEGTTMAAEGPPARPVRWSAEKLARAQASVAWGP